MLQVGDIFYWLRLPSLEDWEPGYTVICCSKVTSIHTTGMYENHKGRYFYPSECYRTREEAKVALKNWLDNRREIINEVLNAIEKDTLS